MQRKYTAVMMVLALALCAAPLALTGCGDDSQGFSEHEVYIKVGGYYVAPSTNDIEKAKLRVGIFGLSTKDGSWIEVSSAYVTKHPNDTTVKVAALLLDTKPDKDITKQQSTLGADYYLLESRAWFDTDGDNMFTAVDLFVDGKSGTSYDLNDTKGYFYFFLKDSPGEGAEYGYNFQPGSSYSQNFEDVDPLVANSQFFVDTKKQGK